MTSQISIVEVGPRDGLQNEDVILTTDQKLLLIDHLVQAGLTRIEAVSFSHPDYVPQMADAEAVMAGLGRNDSVSYIGLVMNRRGWQRAIDAGVDEVNIPVFATETFNERNQGVRVAETMDTIGTIAEAAGPLGISVSATIGVSWGCPFEGEVPSERVVHIAQRLAELGVDEIALADTIGVADPWSVADRLGAVGEVIGCVPRRVHFHDTRATGMANAHAAIAAGVATLDASVGGIGGCPFAPAATGNIATDDLTYMLDRAGYETGIDLEQLIGTSHELAHVLGKELPAAVPRAGLFPHGEDLDS